MSDFWRMKTFENQEDMEGGSLEYHSVTLILRTKFYFYFAIENASTELPVTLTCAYERHYHSFFPSHLKGNLISLHRAS